MAKTNLVLKLKRTVYIISAAAMLMVYYPSVASAAQITTRKVTIGSSAASVSTTYLFNFTVPSATVIKSVGVAACTTASGACTPAPGFSSAASTLTTQPSNLDGAGVNTGWIVSVATTTELRLSKSGATVAPTGAQSVGFSGVVNPSATNSTFYMRITTYSDAAWTTAIDTGVVAASTAGQITVTASVDETLSFTLGTTTVALGALSTSATGSGTSNMTAATNAATGYSITVAGTTLTSGSNTITAITPTAAASATNTKQFGINLMSNTTPSIGTATSGGGSGTPSSGYNTANQFKFTTGDTVASASLPTNSNTYTVSYIANIDGSTAAGAYSTILTYVATANF